jgi:hypothetical protein
VTTALAFAEEHGCLELKKACFQFLASLENLMAIIGTDAFENLKSAQPNILEELVANVDAPPDMLSSSEPILAMPAHTSSTIVAKVVSGSHVLTVQGYSDIQLGSAFAGAFHPAYSALEDTPGKSYTTLMAGIHFLKIAYLFFYFFITPMLPPTRRGKMQVLSAGSAG